MKTKTAQVFIHVVASLAFLSVPVLSSPDLYHFSELFSIPPFLREFLFYLLLIGFYYLDYFVLIPRFYLRKHYALFSLLTFLCFVVALIVPLLLIPHEFHHRTNESHPPLPIPALPMFFRGTVYQLFTFLVVAFFSLVIRLNSQWRKTQEEKKDSELSYLKAQINPHFLFNTLNSIYSLAITKSDETPKAIVKLSGMMRYVTSEASAGFVPLSKELCYIYDYVELQRLRLGNTIQLSYTVTGDPGKQQVVPLLLIPFVENAFKHGVNPEEDSRIDIVITINDPEIKLSVVNNKVKERICDSTGIGVDTTIHRLQLSYPSRHTLLIEDNENRHSVLLTLRLS